MLISPKKNVSGFTLIELMIALALNALLLTALLTVFLANLDHYRKMINVDRFNQQLHMAMLIMTSDIRRAGYSANANNDIGLDQNTNPFVATGADLSINTANNCILFTYDYNKNGTLPAISAAIDDDRYGYRLNGQTLQARPPGADFSCTAAASNWENVTDPNFIQITQLSFTLNSNTITTGPGTKGLTMRSVDISITGTLTSDSAITKTLTQHVRIRNDKFIP